MKRLDAREKVKLLAATYLDACEAKHADGEGRRGGFESKLLDRNRELWEQGSYKAFEVAMDEFRQTSRKNGGGSYLRFWRVYVRRTHPPEPKAEAALALVVGLVERATGRNIYVPGDIVENAGWTLQDAKSAARPRRLAA